MIRWSDDDIDYLGRLIDKGLSGSEAATLLGRTRVAAIGKAWKLGWSFGRVRTDAEKARVVLNAQGLAAARRLRQMNKLPPGKKAGHAVCVTFDDDTYAEVLRRAKVNRSSRAQIVRELVEWGLEAGLPA